LLDRTVTLVAVEGFVPRAPRGRRGPAVIALVTAVLFAACTGDEQVATRTPARTSAARATASLVPSEIAQPSDAAESLEPSLDPDASPTPLESPTAAACTGTEANRAFYVTVATHVSWDVYCPVLPKGWIVDAGSYRTSGGGWLKIAYKASGGRRFELQEGAFCTATYGCAPTGSDAASGPFGDREASVIAVDDGSFAMVVDAGNKISWLAIGKGIDEPTFRATAEALIRVGG
jgi:hypothetical protein